MSDDYFTPWQDSITEFKAQHMNAPLEELDSAIGGVAAAVVSLETSKADTSHNHSGEYSALGHLHDDRYYTESEIDALLVGSGEVGGLYDAGVGIGYQSVDKPAANAVINTLLPYTLTFPTNLTGSGYYAATGPGAEAVVSLKKNGSQFATLTVVSGETSGGNFSGSETAFSSGDRLSFAFPASQDDNWAGVAITLKGVRS